MERGQRGREAHDQLGGWVVCVDEGEVHAACRKIRHNPRYLSCLVLTLADALRVNAVHLLGQAMINEEPVAAFACQVPTSSCIQRRGSAHAAAQRRQRRPCCPAKDPCKPNRLTAVLALVTGRWSVVTASGFQLLSYKTT